MGEGYTVGPTLVDPCPRPRAPKAREARGHGSKSVGPTVDPSPMDPHLNPIKHTWPSRAVRLCRLSTGRRLTGPLVVAVTPVQRRDRRIRIVVAARPAIQRGHLPRLLRDRYILPLP